MNPLARLARMGIFAGLLALVPAVTQAAVVFSDNFESDTSGLNKTLMNNFTVGPGNIDVIPDGGLYDFYPGNGQYVDLIGDSNGTGGKITTSTDTQSGNDGIFAAGTYVVSFNYGYNKNDSDTNTIVISLGTATPTNFVLTSAPSTLLSASFTLTTTTAGALSFQGFTTAPDNGSIILDNVVVTAVPEPASLAMAGTALLAVGGVALRRRKAAAKA